MTQTLQRQFWNGQPEELQLLFQLTNARGARARCSLWSHQLGWELRLDLNGSLIRSQVARSHDQVTSTAAEWKSAMHDRGWEDLELFT